MLVSGIGVPLGPALAERRRPAEASAKAGGVGCPKLRGHPAPTEQVETPSRGEA